MNYSSIIKSIQQNLTNDLRLPCYQKSKNRLAGHCYIASEALYYISERKLKPMFIRHQGEPHWFLRDADKIIDITASQFKKLPDYEKAIGKGFLTNKPSKRTQILLAKLEWIGK